MDKFYKILRIIFMVIVIISIFTKVFAVDNSLTTITINNTNYDVKLKNITDTNDYYIVLYSDVTVSSTAFNYFYVLTFNKIPVANLTGSQVSIGISGGGCTSYRVTGYYRKATYNWSTLFTRWNQYDYSNPGTTTYYNQQGYLNVSSNYSSNQSSISNSVDIAPSNFTSHILLSNFDLKDTNGNTIFNNNTFTSPYIVNDSSDIEDWDFDILTINLGSVQYNESDSIRINYNNNTTIVDRNTINYQYDELHNTITIGRQQISDILYMVPDSTIQFQYNNTIGAGNIVTYDLGSFNVLISSDTAEDINNNSEQNYQNKVIEDLSNITAIFTEGNQQAHQDSQALQNTLTDDTVESSSSDLPSINVGDPSQDGIDNIFQSIYNAFCTGNAQDIVFPIPFTNKNITLSPNYIRNMLNNNGASWVYTFIQVFWAYIVGRFIVKDISKKLTKIKSGNVENIQNDNIKEEML